MMGLRFLIFAACALLTVGLAPAARAAAAFAAPAFERQWVQGEALAPNFWGPLANATDGLQEPYREAPGGQRLVQYFDKGRMELTDPATGTVTNGLLATELTTGQRQLGDSTFEFRQPPDIPIAGDVDNPGPTYAGLYKNAGSIFAPADRRIGSSVQYFIPPDGSVQGVTPTVGTGPYAIAAYDDATRHNVAQAFLDYRNRVGLLTIGYAKSEPFQTSVKVGGQPRQVMVQVFERRILTYNPDNPPAFQVEMGNIGQHYYRWRHQSPPPPAPSLTGALWAWQETKMSDGTTIAVGDPSKYTLQFNPDGTVAIRADCNQILGRYTVSGSQLTITLGPATLIACPPGSQADVFVRQIGEVATHTFSGGDLYLTMRIDSGIMRFAAIQPTSLTGTTWQATGYNNGRGAVESVRTGTELTAVFGTNGQVSGSGGCNTFTGPYQVSGSSLTIGTLATTIRACEPAEIMTQEQAYLAALRATRTYAISGDQLTLRDAAGAMMAVFTVKPSAPAAAVTGTVTYLQRIALEPGSVVTVRLQDISRADAPAIVLGEHVTTTTGNQVPFPYSIAYDPATIVASNTYSVAARITGPDGALRFISMTAHLVITQGRPTSGVEIIVEPV
jgi:heat shock protein HslJ